MRSSIETPSEGGCCFPFRREFNALNDSRDCYYYGGHCVSPLQRSCSSCLSPHSLVSDGFCWSYHDGGNCGCRSHDCCDQRRCSTSLVSLLAIIKQQSEVEYLSCSPPRPPSFFEHCGAERSSVSCVVKIKLSSLCFSVLDSFGVVSTVGPTTHLRPCRFDGRSSWIVLAVMTACPPMPPRGRRQISNCSATRGWCNRKSI